MKSAAGHGKTRFRGLARMRFAFTLNVDSISRRRYAVLIWSFPALSMSSLSAAFIRGELIFNNGRSDLV